MEALLLATPSRRVASAVKNAADEATEASHDSSSNPAAASPLLPLGDMDDDNNANNGRTLTAPATTTPGKKSKKKKRGGHVRAPSEGILGGVFAGFDMPGGGDKENNARVAFHGSVEKGGGGTAAREGRRKHGRSKSDGQGLLLSSGSLDLFSSSGDVSSGSAATPASTPLKSSAGPQPHATPVSKRKAKRNRTSYGLSTPSFASPFSAKKSVRSKAKRRLTPPRPKSTVKRSAVKPVDSKGTASNSSNTHLSLSIGSALGSFDDAGGDGERSRRTSELDPSAFQVELPAAAELRSTAKICAVVGDYLELAGRGGATEETGSGEGAPTDFTFASLLPGGAHFGDASHPVAAKLREATAGGDLSAQGFFREYYGEEQSEGSAGGKQKSGRVEACVFGSQSARQFVVAFRGSSAVQGRPLKGTTMQTKLGVSASEEPTLPLHPQEHPSIPVVASFAEAYLAPRLESDLFRHLEQLTALHPFCDVVFTGHSFGAALATLGAVRYASLRPRIRVSCHAFGSPRVGGTEFRHLAHSLPNLKILRVENGLDPYVSAPEGNGWEHVGHGVTMNDATQSVGGGEMPQKQWQPSEASNVAPTLADPLQVRAYRFGKGGDGGPHRSTSSNNLFRLAGAGVGGVISKMANPGQWLALNGSSGAEADHDVEAYVDKLERVSDLPEKFVGLEGDGIRARDDGEVRCVV